MAGKRIRNDSYTPTSGGGTQPNTHGVSYIHLQGLMHCSWLAGGKQRPELVLQEKKERCRKDIIRQYVPI